MNFERLFLLKQSNGLTQEEMGKILNVGRVAISQWENTVEIIPLNKLNAYANYFNVSLDYITKLSDEKKKTKKIMLDKETIGRNIRLLRKEFKLTQKDLANVLNTSHSTISAYEAGKTMLLTVFALQICEKYGISLDYLCGRTNNKYLKVKAI